MRSLQNILDTRRVVRAGRRSTIGNRVGSNPVSRVRIPYSPYFVEFLVWPVGQAVKTPPFHGGIPGSIPGRVTTWTISSAGRAPALQAGCRQFDPVIVHQSKRLSSDDRFLVSKSTGL